MGASLLPLAKSIYYNYPESPGHVISNHRNKVRVRNVTHHHTRPICKMALSGFSEHWDSI